MAGYTRQSSSSIVNTLDITAAPLNAEFNQVQTAFGTSGHTHTGVAGDGPKIPLSTSVSGYLPAANGGTSGKNNFSATADPAVTDDVDLGYAVGSLWINTTTDRMHVCVDNTDGAAVWRAVSHISAADGALVPDATDTKDIGTLNNRWQDLYLSGGAVVGGTATVGNNLVVTNDCSAASFTTTSDYRAKSVDGNVAGATENIMAIQPIMGKRSSDTKSRAMFIAHELQTVAPWAVTGEKDDEDIDGIPVYQTVDYSSLVPLLWAALQEANIRIQNLENMLVNS